MSNDRRWEVLWPYAASIAIGLVWWFGLSHKFPTDIAALMSAAGTVAAVWMGFLGTSKAIILSISRSAVFKKLKETGYDKDLFSYIKSSIVGNTAILTISIIGFFVDTNPLSGEIFIIYTFQALWIILFSFAIFSFLRVMNILFKLAVKV